LERRRTRQSRRDYARARPADGTGRWHLGQRHGHDGPMSSCSGTSSSCWRASLAFVRTAPGLLGNGPTLHPIGKSRVAVVWLGHGSRWGATASLVRAAFTMNTTAPFFLGDRPARLPVREPICAVVRICWSRRLRRLAANVVVTAAPGLFGSVPREILTHSAVVWIDRSHGSRRRCGRRHEWTRRWRRRRPRRGPRGGRCGRRRRRRRREWRGWDCRRGLWQSCGRATPANCHAAVVFLRLGPGHLDHVVAPSEVTPSEVAPRAHASPTIVWQRGGRARQEPEQKRD